MTLEIITSDALSDLRHGFFTRRGGASSGIFTGLNCGVGSSDQSEAVAINLGRVADAMEVTPETLHTLRQIHSTDVAMAHDLTAGERPRADALVTNQPGLALGVLSADCQPVLFADVGAGVIGAAHAGWKGALNGVLDTTVEAMTNLGAQRDQIIAIIGPSISQRAYEVGPEFFETFYDADPEYARFFANGKDDRMQFDLPGFGLYRLRNAGVGQAEWTRHCTYHDPALFYSYRRSVHQNQADYGRLISSIRL